MARTRSGVDSRTNWRRPARASVGAGAILALAALQASFAAPALAAMDPTADSVAQGKVAKASAGGSNVLELGISETSFPGQPGPQTSSLSGSVLGSPTINLGSLQLPLFKNDAGQGLISLGQAGLFSSYAESPSDNESKASAGVLGEGGAIALSPNAGAGTDPAYIDLTDLFGQLGVQGLTDQVLSEARFELGGFASQAVCVDGDITSEYVLGHMALNLESPLLGDLTGYLPGLVGSVVSPIEDVVNNLVLAQLQPLLDKVADQINGLDIGFASVSVSDLALSLSGFADFAAALTANLTGEFSNSNGSLVVDASQGKIYVDVAGILGDLNNLPANTEVLSTVFVQRVLDGLTDVVISMAETVVDSTLDALGEINLTATGTLTASTLLSSQSAGLTISGSVLDYLGLGTSPDVDLDLVINIPFVGSVDVGALVKPLIQGAFNDIIGPIVQPIVNGLLADVGGYVGDLLGDVIGDLLEPLEDTFEEIFGGVLSIVVNDQSMPGDLGADSFTVSAMTVTVLDSVSASLGTSTVRCIEDDGSDDEGSDEAGSDEDGSDEAGSDEDGSDEDGSDEAGSDEDGSDEAGSDEDGSDDGGDVELEGDIIDVTRDVCVVSIVTEVSGAGDYVLYVWDDGEIVDTFEWTMDDAGTHTVTWTINRPAGDDVPGVGFYLETADGTELDKVDPYEYPAEVAEMCAPGGGDTDGGDTDGDTDGGDTDGDTDGGDTDGGDKLPEMGLGSSVTLVGGAIALMLLGLGAVAVRRWNEQA